MYLWPCMNEHCDLDTSVWLHAANGTSALEMYRCHARASLIFCDRNAAFNCAKKHPHSTLRSAMCLWRRQDYDELSEPRVSSRESQRRI